MGHGHVIPNKDGSVARCGGPAICSECAREQAAENARIRKEPKKLTKWDAFFFFFFLERDDRLR